MKYINMGLNNGNVILYNISTYDSLKGEVM